jgi:adenylate cyclase
VRSLRDRIMAIGARPTDSPELALRKGALVLISVSITALATVWTLTYWALGLPLVAASPLAYQVISVTSLVWLARTGDFDMLRFVQIAAILVLPFTMQWTLGGFESSSAVMVWAFAGPLSALVFYGSRGALVSFGAYIGLAVVSGVLEWLNALPQVDLGEGLRLAFFVLNIGGVSVVTFAVLLYFVRALDLERGRSQDLLHNVLPPPIARRLLGGEQLIADDHRSVSVLFADVAGFTPLVHDATADEVIGILNQVFTAFDELAAVHGLEKIKTIGDEYMAVAGAPEPRSDHAAATAEMALDMLDVLAVCSARLDRPLQLRVGIHSGPAVAGVIGRRKFAYDLWGDAVNVASRMESHGVAGRIQVSAAVREALADDPRYRLEERGSIEIKGIGEMTTYFLERA